jgi:hypothetical protein
MHTTLVRGAYSEGRILLPRPTPRPTEMEHPFHDLDGTVVVAYTATVRKNRSDDSSCVWPRNGGQRRASR